MARSFRGLWTRLIFVFALAATALAQSPVSDDTFVTSASPSSTNGSSPSLVVQAPAGWTFIKLDLSRIPAGTQASAVSKATLKLYVTAATAQGAFDVFRVDSTWKEANLTYSNSTTPNQSAQALVLAPITTGTCSGTPVQCVTTTSKYVIVDVTSIVKDWLNFQNGVGGSHANNGIAFRPSSGSSISVTFESKESTTTGHDSDLEIDYSTSLASIPGTIGPSQVAAGTYAINISGTAATAAQFDHITNQCAANLFSTGITTGGNANCSPVLFSSLSGTATNAQLPAAIVFNNQANTFGAGFKQIFTPSATFAGLNVVGAVSDPTTLSNGDLWINTTAGRLNLRSAGVTKQFAFLDDVSSPTNIQNSQLAHSSITINSGSGLNGGGTVSLGSALTLSIPNAGVSNSMLQNSSIGVTAGTGIAVAGTTSLGGAFSIANTGVLSFNGRVGTVVPQSNDYSFAQLSGTDSATSHLVYNNQSNTFGINFKQIFQAGNNIAGLNIAGVSSDPNSANLQPGDLWFNTGSNHLIFRDGLGNTKTLAFTNDTINGTFTGDGSGLTNLNAAQLSSGTVPPARLSGTYGISIGGNAASITGSIPETQVTNLTTDLGNLSSNISSEASTRVSADTNLQNNINSEAVTRASADTTLSGSIAAEISRAQGAETTITGNLNNEITRATAAEGTKADLVKPVQLNNAAAANASCSDVNGLVLNPNQPSGQQMFICRDIGGGTLQWQLINDDATSTAADHTYTDQQVAIEATARTSADNAETSARQFADTTLQSNIDSEAAARAAADTAETNRATAAETSISNSVSAESVRAITAETALGASIAAETTRAAGAESTITTNLNAESSRATAAESTKADLVKPVQLDNAAAVNGSCAAVNALVLNAAEPSGQQLFICRDIGGGTLQWQLINDDAATTAADHTYTDSQITIEATARQNADNAEASARGAADTTLQNNIDSEVSRAQAAEAAEASARAAADAAEALARAAGDAASLATANAYTDAETARATAAEATKPNLAGGNSFTGDQTITAGKFDVSAATATLPVQATNTTPPASGQPSACVSGQMLLQTNGAPGQQLFICNSNLDGWVMVNDDTASSATDHSYTDSQITIEATARQNADSAEASARTAADTTLQNNIDAEAATRAAADSAEATARAAADAAEALARAAGDAASLATANAYADAETARATAAEATKANLAGGNSFTGDQTITAGKFDVSAATATLPVQATNTTPPASGQPSACVSGQMLLQTNGAPGQQLFICNSNLDGWVMVNDDTTSTAADHTYTDQQVAAEASARATADNVEAAARQAADTTLQSNIDSEAAARAAADTAETNRATAAETSINNSVSAESVRAITAETALGASIAAETTRATGAESTITTNLNAEISRATAAEVTKADLVKPVQLDNAAAVNGSCTTVNALVLNAAEPSGQQMFICRDIGGGTLQWQLINDDAATTAADHTYTDQQVAAEASARTSADSAEASARQAADTTLQSNIDAEVSRAQSAEAAEAAARTAADNAEAVTRAAADAAEATARVAGDAASVTSAYAYTDSAVTTINNSLATKANLTGGNSFTGDQTVNGTLSLPAVAAGPSASQALDMAGADGGNQPALFRWQVNNTGFLNLSTATSGNPAQDSGLKIGSDGKITFAAGQAFPGTQSSLTAGSGISILSNTISNTGVLSFNGRNGGVVPASGDYSFSQISGSITPGQAGGGTYGIDISGNAATATLAASATSAGNASLLSGEAAATAATASTIAARDSSGDLFANIFHGSGALLTNLPSTALPGTIVYNDQANTYTAGSKQTFKASASLAGLNIFGVATNPTGPLVAGDAWYNTTANRLNFYNGTATKNLAFTDDNITGNAANVTGTVAVANGGTGAATASGARTNLSAAASGANSDITSMTVLTSITSAVTMGNASNSFSGSGAGLTALNATQLTTGTVAAARMPGLTGDVTSTTGTVATTLANSGVTAGTFTAASITVDAKGRVTAASSNTIPTVPTPTVAVVATSQTRSNTVYGDLTTPGPAVTVNVPTTQALVTVTTLLSNGNNPGTGCFAGFAVSGNTTVAATDTRSVRFDSYQANGNGGPDATQTVQMSATYLVTSLTAGNNTFTVKYRSSSGTNTCTFANRNIIVTPY